jgi:hypothetical protein
MRSLVCLVGPWTGVCLKCPASDNLLFGSWNTCQIIDSEIGLLFLNVDGESLAWMSNTVRGKLEGGDEVLYSEEMSQGQRDACHFQVSFSLLFPFHFLFIILIFISLSSFSFILNSSNFNLVFHYS